MSEIYWITRLGYINNISLIVGVVALIISVFMIIMCIIQSTEVVEGRHDYDHEKKQLNMYKSIRNWGLSISIIFMLIFTFIPTTKEALMIWGIGSTIDYIKTNDKVQQLPDKCINALDAWVESLNTEKK